MDRAPFRVVHAPIFDPLVELHGLWTTQLADRYLPIEGVPPAKYECVDGRLVLTPTGHTNISYAIGRLAVELRESAKNASVLTYARINLWLDIQRWIEPDLAVLRKSAGDVVWVRSELALVAVEVVPGPGRIDRAAMCEDACVPYFLRAEIADDSAHLELLRLVNGKYVPHAEASAGQRFRTELPFPMSLDPAELLVS